MDPLRIRVVGGFAQAGWLDGKQLLDAPHITLEDEVSLIDGIKLKLQKGMELLGVDAYGVDYCADGVRKRVEFKTGPVLADAAKAALARVVKNL